MVKVNTSVNAQRIRELEEEVAGVKRSRQATKAAYEMHQKKDRMKLADMRMERDCIRDELHQCVRALSKAQGENRVLAKDYAAMKQEVQDLSNLKDLQHHLDVANRKVWCRTWTIIGLAVGQAIFILLAAGGYLG